MRKSFYGISVVVLCTLGLTGYALAQELLTNEGFETWTAGPGGPPDNWALSDDTLLVAAQESGTVRTGSYSVAFTCSTTYTRELYQTVTIPDTDTCYTFSCYAWDNDSLGRARVGIYWYAADDSTIVGSYLPNTYTTDQALWQQLTTGSTKVPAGAVYAHCEIRIYDENADTTWTHTTLYFDDASFTQTACPPPSDTLTIAEIQFNNTDPGGPPPDICFPSPYAGTTKITRGIVTQRGIADGFPDFWIQDADTAWSGIFIFQPTETPNPGDEVVLTAQISEYYGVTEMSNLTSYEVVSTGNPVPDPIDITPGDLADSYLAGCDAGAEKYEGLLVKLTNVICAVDPDSTHQYAGFYVTDFAYTDTCQIEYYIYEPYAPAVGDTFLSITGIVHYSRGEYDLNPRKIADVVWLHPPIPPGPDITGISHTPTIPGDATPVRVMASIFDTAATVQSDSVLYQVNGTAGTWTGVVSDSVSSNYYYFTIPGQSDGDTVYFYAYAENDTGGVSTSPTHKYLVLDEFESVTINEFLYDKPGADAGCFIELYGPPTLSLNGWSLVMVNGFDGTDKKVINLTGSIPADGFFVVAQDATVPDYDMIDPLADFENGPDNIHLRKGDFNYDAIGYGSFDRAEYFMGETWPTYDPGFPYGFSLGRYLDGADTDYNRRDFGVYGGAYNTPGDTNLAPSARTIREVQDPAAKADYTGERVVVGGIVTADPVECTYNPGYYIEMSSGGGWSGVLVYDLFYEPTRGDSVQVTGTVADEFGRTQISYVTGYNNYGAGNMPPSLPVFTTEVAAAESLEGVLVQVQSVTVTDTLGYGEFNMTDGSGACMADDICGYATKVEPGDEFGIIRGVVDYSFGSFKVQPRDEDDFIEFYPADLTAALSSGAKSSSGDVFLEWTSSSAPELHYVIFRSTDPTAMGDSLDSVVPPGDTYTDVGAVGSTTTNYYYVVQARFAGGAPANSKQVGEFDKDLTNVK
jgi:hypothetical protein